MIAVANGYYDGNSIVLDEKVDLTEGQRVIVTFEMPNKTEKKIDLSKYMGRGEKMFNTDANDYVRELRENDRL